MNRRSLFAALASLALFAGPAAAEPTGAPAQLPSRLAEVLDEAAAIEALETVVVAVDGRTLAERGYNGHSPADPTNIKSASKAVVSALVGIAIDRGLLAGTDQRIAPLLADRLPEDPDPRLSRVTIGHLLSMQAGLQPVSGPEYGSWVASRDWVRDALRRPFVAEPGGRMLYSTGSSHLLSAILTKLGGRPTLALARDWLAPLDGFRIASWDRDPQGIHFGGNQMAMSPRSLLAFGELYRRGGRTADGRQLLPQTWVDRSFAPRTTSRWTGDGYGYGWFLRRIAGREVHYAWGYGGQMLYLVPSLDLTVVMTSDETRPSARTGHRDRLHGLLGEIIAAVEASPAAPSGDGDQRTRADLSGASGDSEARRSSP